MNVVDTDGDGEMMMLMMTMPMSMEIMMLDGPIGENVLQSLDMTTPKPEF